jgi:hypothetical protein
VNSFASKLLDFLDGERLIMVCVGCLGLMIIDFAVAITLVTNYGSYGPPYYNPLLNMPVCNPMLYNILICLSLFEEILLCLLFVVGVLLVFVFAMVVKCNRNIGSGEKQYKVC